MYEEVSKLLLDYARRSEDILKRILKQKGKDKSGATINSIRTAIEFNTIGVPYQIDLLGSKVVDYINDGRPSGAKLPPKGALLAWMRRVGIPEAKEFVVRRSIAKNGIAAVPVIDLAFIEIKREFNNNVSDKTLSDISKIIFTGIQKGIEINIK